jgi:FkbM family methyltransferase
VDNPVLIYGSLMKRFINKILKTFGYKITYFSDYGSVSPEVIWKNLFSNHLKSLFKIFDVNCVFDVGAHIGTYRDFLRRNVGYSGLIISFEPIKKHLDVLKERSKNDKNWKVEPYALGSKEANKTINVMATSDFSSFLEPNYSNLNDIKFGVNQNLYQLASHNVIDYQEMCDVKCLDSVIEDFKLQNDTKNMFLKMDTQGYDLEVIKGAKKTLPSILALQTEISALSIYQSMPDYLFSLKTLAQEGFDITFLNPISMDRFLRIVEFDCILINRYHIKQCKENLG